MAIKVGDETVTQASARVRIRLIIPEHILDHVAGQIVADPSEPYYFEEVLRGVEEWVKDNIAAALALASDEPEVEADG